MIYVINSRYDDDFTCVNCVIQGDDNPKKTIKKYNDDYAKYTALLNEVRNKFIKEYGYYPKYDHKESEKKRKHKMDCYHEKRRDYINELAPRIKDITKYFKSDGFEILKYSELNIR